MNPINEPHVAPQHHGAPIHTCIHTHTNTHTQVRIRGTRAPAAARTDGGVVLKLADFGSALDPFAAKNLYGDTGPSRLDETLDYAPPEVVFARTDVPLSYMRPQSYDLWSVGVVFLELVLASSKVCARVEGLRPLL